MFTTCDDNRTNTLFTAPFAWERPTLSFAARSCTCTSRIGLPDKRNEKNSDRHQGLCLTWPPNEEEDTTGVLVKAPLPNGLGREGMQVGREDCLGQSCKSKESFRGGSHWIKNVECRIAKPHKQIRVDTDQVESVKRVPDDFSDRPRKYHRGIDGVGVCLCCFKRCW
jgi:hypothetical protein